MSGLLRRYKSPIYGNYRKASLLYGAATGVIIFLFVVIQWLAGNAISAPETYSTDIVMGVCLFTFSYLYRKQLPEQKVFFKEIMILGLGIGFISGLVYGLSLLLYGQIDVDFCERCISTRVSTIDPADGFDAENAIKLIKDYTLGDWAFIGGFRRAVMSIIIAFAAAIMFKTEQNIRR